MISKKLCQLWLLFFVVASLIAKVFSEQIQSHALENSLLFGFDPFGRNCILLSLNAATQSLSDIALVGIFTLVLSLVLSFFTLMRGAFHFVWNAFWEMMSSLPGFFIALSLAAFFPKSKLAFPIAVLLLIIPYLIRFYEGQILHLVSQEYFKQGIALGGSAPHLFKTHIAPELILSTKTILPFLITRLLIVETSLTFIGSKQPGDIASWGELLFMGKDYLLEAPWIIFFTALPLFLTLFSFHLLSKNEHT